MASQNRLTVAIEKMANGEGYKNLLIDVYGILETGVNILGGLLDNLDKIAVAVLAISLMTKSGSILGGISHIAGGYSNFAHGFSGGINNTFTGITGIFDGIGHSFQGFDLRHPFSSAKTVGKHWANGIGKTLIPFANAQQIYQYGAAVNRGAQKIGIANASNLGLQLDGSAFAGNVFSPTDLNKSTSFLTNSNVYGLFGGMKSNQIKGSFNQALLALNDSKLSNAYNNYILALQGNTESLHKGKTAEQKIYYAKEGFYRALQQADFAGDQVAKELIELAAQAGMTGDQLAGSALIMRQNGVNNSIPKKNNLGKQFGNIGMMLGGSIAYMGGSAAIKEMGGSDTASMMGGMGLSMLSMWAPYGTAAAFIFGTIGGLWAHYHKTDEEILEEAQKASEELSEIRTQTKDLEDSSSNTQSQEGRFKELLKGVNVYTGQNVSLSDSEWSEYQEILSSLIDNNPNLYADYDENGNIIAKTADKFADLNTVMSDTISLQKEELALKYKTLASDTEKLSSEMLGSIIETEQTNAGVTTKKERDPMSLSYDSFGLDKTKSIWEFGHIGVNDEDITTETREKYGWGTVTDNPIIDYIDVFEAMKQGLMTLDEAQKILKHSEGIIDFTVGIVTGNGYNEEFTKEEIQQGYENYLEYGQDRTDQVEAVKQQYRADMFQNINYALLGNENYRGLSAQGQSLVSSMFRNLQVNPYTDESTLSKKSKDQIKKSVEDYQKAAIDISKHFADNPILLSDFENYDQNTATVKDEQNLLSRWQDVLDTTDLSDEQKYALLKGKGYHASGFEWGTDENGNKVITKMGTWETQRDVNTKILSSGDYKINSDLLNQLTGIEFAKLFAQRDRFKGFTGTISELRNQLKELVLGETANASEYFASLASELGLTTTNTKELIKAIQSGNVDGSFELSKLQEIADNLGVSVETLVENISILGDINTFGQTEKSLSEIETQFEHIDAISQDLSDNGMISAENLETLINEFPELVQYIDDFDTLLSKLQDMGDLKTIKIQASIAGSIADSDKIFDDFLTEQFGDNKGAKVTWGMFGNLSNMQNMIASLYDVQRDKNGNIIDYNLKSYYDGMKLRAGETDSGTYADNSWAKLIAENMYGIDTSKGSTNEINQKLYEALKTSATSSGMSLDQIKNFGEGGLTQLLTMVQGNLLNNPEYMFALQGVATAEANLKAGKAAKQVENEEWEKNISKAISDLKDDYGSGKIGIDNYITGLEQLSKHSKITKDQLKELKETIEDVKFEKLSKQFEDGAISVSKYRSELSALMKQNALGSDDYEKYLDAYLGTFDSELDKLDGQKSLLYEKDYSGQRSLLNQENVILTEKLAALEAAGLKNTKDYLDTLEKVKSNKEQQLEITKQELEYQKEQLETTMGAYNTLADYAIKQLEKERDLVEERYDEEIDKLQEVNDQKQRSIELTKLQQELENAQKEKSRVYVAGRQ